MEETIKRCKAFIEAGADMIFPEGLATEAEFAQVAQELKRFSPETLLLANMTEFGKTPMIPFTKFKDLGYNCVIYPVTTLRVTMKAVDSCLDVLQKEGTAEPLLSHMQTRKELYNLLDYTPGVEWYYPNSTKK